MILLDSSAWIEYLVDGPQASKVETYIVDASALKRLIVPTLVLYEVYRQLLKKADEREALLATAQMEKGRVVSLDPGIALRAAELSLQYRLGTADAVIYATALLQDAEVVTLDNDFRQLPQCLVLV